MSKITYFTKEGLKKLNDELHHLKTKGRADIAKQIAEARDKGDLSENAEYDAAKDAQGLHELKISKLEESISNARIIDESDINTDKESLYLDFHIIKKWLEYTNQIKSSISHSFSWDEFHSLSDKFISNHQKCEIGNLVKEIEYFLGDIKQNTNPKFSLMNMFINSHNSLN